MRDPERIDAVVELLRDAWKANPDMRLGQLVVNAGRYVAPGLDPWFIEEDQWTLGLILLNANTTT